MSGDHLSRKSLHKRKYKRKRSPETAAYRRAMQVIWHGMLYRCHDPSNKHYSNYGARGIAVCDRWRSNFEYFLEDMPTRPPGMSVERIDNNGNYEPANCRWATAHEQARNKRNNRLITWNNETRTITDWGVMLGIHPQTLFNRLFHHKWPIDRVMTQPAGSSCASNRLLTFNGETLPLSKMAIKYGISRSTLSDRLEAGVELSVALVPPTCKKREGSIHIEFNGRSGTPGDWAEWLNLPECTIRGRLMKGWAVEEVLKPVTSRNGRLGKRTKLATNL